MLRIVLPLAALLALVGCKKDKDEDTGADARQEMTEQR